MDTKYLVYDLKDDLNLKRFIRKLEKEGYSTFKEDTLPIPYKNFSGINKDSSSTQGAIGTPGDPFLYVFTDFNGDVWRNLKGLAEDFEIE